MPASPISQTQTEQCPPANRLLISAVNINSITAPDRLQELNHFVEDHAIDVLAVSEMKIDSSTHPALYSLQHFHRPVMKLRTRRGGGVAVFVRNTLPFTHISQLDNEEIEAVWIKIKVKNTCIVVCSSYLPPHSTADKQQHVLDYLTDSVSQAQEHLPSAIIVAGDMNAGNCWLPENSPRHFPHYSIRNKVEKNIGNIVTHPAHQDSHSHSKRHIQYTRFSLC